MEVKGSFGCYCSKTKSVSFFFLKGWFFGAIIDRICEIVVEDSKKVTNHPEQLRGIRNWKFKNI